MLKRLAAFFFPERCIICDRIIPFCRNEICICSHCLEKLVFLDEVKTCNICGSPYKGEGTLCETCLTHKHYFDKALACLPYHTAVRNSILLYKFGSRRDLCRGFSALLAVRIMKFHIKEPFDLVVCAPLSKASLKERNYNQTALLARRVAKRLKVPVCLSAFDKMKETPKQSTLHYQERFQNVEGAFRLREPAHLFSGKRILLIDDVLTTGATADALAKLLKKAKASHVTVLTLASTQKEPEISISRSEVEEITF